MMYLSQITMQYTLNLYSAVRLSYLSKTRRRKKNNKPLQLLSTVLSQACKAGTSHRLLPKLGRQRGKVTAEYKNNRDRIFNTFAVE